MLKKAIDRFLKKWYKFVIKLSMYLEGIMTVTIEQTEKLLKGSQKFKIFPFSMMLTHLKETYANDSSQPVLERCTEDINAFLVKYHSIMTEDYAIIEKI